MKFEADQINLNIFQYLEKSDHSFFFIQHADTGECLWSDNAKELFACNLDKTNVAEWQSLLHPSDYEAFSTACLDIQRRHTRQFFGEYRFALADGQYAWVQCNGIMVTPTVGQRPYLSGLVTRLESRNNIDSVTNLRYIGSFCNTLEIMTAESTHFGILLIGLDDFKRINNLYSYSFGDKVLARFATAVEAILPSQAHLFRLDGDSFGIIMPILDVADLIYLFDQIQAMVQVPLLLDGVFVSLTISGGICRYPDDGMNADTLYRNARIAIVESKGRGKKQVTVCSPGLCSQAQRRMTLLEVLRESVQNQCEGFCLRYQPLIHADDETLYGCEVLMRFYHPQFPEGVSPYEFIPILESSDLIFEVNKWLLFQSFTQCARWVEIFPEFQMNVNFSCSQFEKPDFSLQVMAMLSQTGLKPSAITLELTESGAVTDMDTVSNVFNFFRSQGIKIALDDFGTGYSSLSIFQMLKADELKIDRSFLSRLTYDITDQALVRQIIQLCHGINMMVCVEGIESDKVMEIVREFSPELLQGFYYDRPLTSEEFETRYLRNGGLPQTASRCGKAPELSQSMVYSSIRPTQPLAMDELVNNAHAGIFQVAMDASFSFITCNEGYRKMLGYTALDIEKRFGNFALGIVYPDDMNYVNEEIRRQLGEGDTVTIEFRVVRADGTPIWILGTGNVVKGADGLTSLVVIILDINEIKAKQLAIARKCNRFERILSNIPVGVKCVQNNEDFDLDYMSPAFLSLLGYEEKDLENLFHRKYINMVLEEDRPVVLSDVLDQVQHSSIVTLRYRSPCKNGLPIWVETISRLCPPEEDGIQRWYSSVVNITDSISEEQKKNTRCFANRIQTATEQWGDVLFEYDFATDTISFSSNYEVLFGRKPNQNMYEETKNLHPEDQYRLEEAVQMMHWGIQPPLLEVRYHSEQKGYFWISIQFTPPHILAGKPVSAIGKISNIDDEKKERDHLLQKSRLDCLTGLLNKKTVEDEIRTCITENKNKNNAKTHALCVLDIDDFKGINDCYGHLFGDQVLTTTARRLLHLMGEHALVGRAGGDEFIVFVPLGDPFGNQNELGEAIIKYLAQDIPFDGQTISPSFSVGISTYPTDGMDFYGLYRLADSALYRAKANGKNAYHVASGN